jgi:hypothetical protein
MRVEGLLDEVVDVGVATEFSAVKFHLANFIPYIGSGVANPEGGWRARRFVLESSIWKVTIDGLHGREHGDALEAGAHLITHCGLLERTDGKSFGRDEAAKCLQELDDFLSFVAGFWVACSLPSASDGSGANWERWSLGRIDRQRRGFSWFSEVAGEGSELSRAYRGYCERVADPIWEEAVHFAIYWYVSARRTTDISPALVMAHTGLELLAWVVLVEDKKALTGDGYEKLWASDRARLLLTLIGVDRSVPASLTELTKGSPRGQKWLDGPHAVSDHRNAVMHPTLKNRTKAREMAQQQSEVVELSLWYLELCLLNLFGYQGQYISRVDEWVHIDVPWRRANPGS